MTQIVQKLYRSTTPENNSRLFGDVTKIILNDKSNQCGISYLGVYNSSAQGTNEGRVYHMREGVTLLVASDNLQNPVKACGEHEHVRSAISRLQELTGIPLVEVENGRQ